MKYIKHIIVLAAIAYASLASSLYAQTNQSGKYNFNSQWKLYVGDDETAKSPSFDDSKWKTVTLPYAWNQEEAFNKSIHELSTGIAWYRKTFKIPASAKGKKVFLEFEGVRHGAEFYVNGKSIGIHENGVMAVGFDISEFVLFGKANVVAVRTDNDWKYRERATNSTYQWNNDNFNANYGGIPKNVNLYIKENIYQTLPLYSNLGTTGVYVYASQIDVPGKTALINVESQVRNETSLPKSARLQIEVIDLAGDRVALFDGPQVDVPAGQTATAKASRQVGNLEFWSWGYGYLYNVVSRLVVDNKVMDETPIRTGFRKTEFKNGMVYLNDRVIQIKGYAQRTSNEWPAIGMSCPPWMSDLTNRLMVESNANTVRWMHVTPWKQDVESCDRVGLIQAMPAGDAEKDVEGRRWEHRVELMRDAIIYNRNSPSILFYEGGNESISEAHMQELKDVRDMYDPFGGRAIGSREMLDSKVAEYGGEMLYINKSARLPMWAMEYSRDEGLRKYWDEYTYPYHKDGDGPLYRNAPATDYNRNQDSHAMENIRRWFDYWEQRPGTGERCSSGGVNIVFSDTNTHFRGAENYRRSGEVDAMRLPKDGFYAHRVMWDGWVDVENPRTHIIGHWNYADTVTKPVYVVSSADKVELFLNGRSVGFGKKSHGFLYTIDKVRFEAGKLKAVGYDASGSVLSNDVKETTGNAVAIKLTPITSPVGLVADGADIAMFDVEVVDAIGRRVPTAFHEVTFTLEGPASWLGGIAQGPNNCIMAKTLPVECGVNRVMVRASNKSGAIKLQASAIGLAASSSTITSKKAIAKDGLSKKFAADGLPVNLSRGATPATPSFTPSRKTVRIASVEAGANSDKARQSFDDNELTEWTNDGLTANGWVKYTLEKPATLTQCVVKFTGWRMRSYPIRIMVDGVEVYKGNTPQSLGYVTLPLKPVKGNVVAIQLLGASTESDAFGQIVEVEAGKDLDLFKDPNAANSKGQLRIVEVEFYE
jgi:beta-galactosidase